MTHKEKIKLANKLITPLERKIQCPLFLSAGWKRRELAIKKRLAKDRFKKKLRRARIAKAKLKGGDRHG